MTEPAVSQHGRFVLAPPTGRGKQRVPDLRIIYNSAGFVEDQCCQLQCRLPLPSSASPAGEMSWLTSLAPSLALVRAQDALDPKHELLRSSGGTDCPYAEILYSTRGGTSEKSVRQRSPSRSNSRSVAAKTLCEMSGISRCRPAETQGRQMARRPQASGGEMATIPMHHAARSAHRNRPTGMKRHVG
jgi:hypothetical protein